MKDKSNRNQAETGQGKTSQQRAGPRGGSLTSPHPCPPRQVPTSRECVGFGAVQEVAIGLVQPASAVLYDYYNPGELLGAMREVGLGGREGCQGSPVAPGDWGGRGGPVP